jgi:hypothetical protein
MNGACEVIEQTLCGCCLGVTAQTPQPITNRPRLSAVAYRVGRQPDFKASLLAALSDPRWPALAGLRTREASDFSIALLDAWATACDILSFYTERLANESYLRTALAQRSVFELARLVGYQPSPGVAASAYIAFTLNTAPGSPDNVLIPAQTRVQSVPGPGQAPQVFETSQDLTAQIAYNAIQPQKTIPWGLKSGDTGLWIQGANNNLNVGDGLLFVAPAPGPEYADFHLVASTAIDSKAGNTYVTWDQPISNWVGSAATPMRVFVFRKKAQIFGAQSPDPRTLSASVQTALGYGGTGDWIFTLKAFGTAGDQVNLDASYLGASPDSSGEPRWIVFVYNRLPVLYQITAAEESAPIKYTLTIKTTNVTLANEQRLYTAARKISNTPTGLLTSIVRHTRNESVYVQSEELTAVDLPYIGPWDEDSTYPRQAGLIKPVEGSSLEITGGQQLNVGQPVGISGKRLRLRVSNDIPGGFVPDGSSLGMNVTAGQLFIVAAFPPGAHGWTVITTVGGVSGALQNTGGFELLPADSKDAAASEAAVINQVQVSGPITTLTFDQGLSGIYDRSTVAVNANVVLASHGETVHEILGSGDSTNPALQFILKQSPLTYVSSSSGMGSISTLEVWVNNLRWQEVDNFLASGPNDRVFVTRPNQNGTVTIQFGDGTTGARPPTGQMNIRAVYRKGIGQAGMVQSGQLSQPLDRPQGVSSSTNPAPATGGGDPDTADTARWSAPLHILTLDRVVSLEDYQNYARAFQGIAKALATWTWFDRVRGVFLTVAGESGATIGDPTIAKLAAAFQDKGNRFVPLTIQSFTPVLFELGAAVLVDTTDYDTDHVLAQVWQSLVFALSFDQRQLGQRVAQSEVIAIIQETPGVVAVEVTAFNIAGDVAGSGVLPTVLCASSPVSGQNGSLQPAEMLLLDPGCQGQIGAWK